jgi:hypothetical protein
LEEGKTHAEYSAQPPDLSILLQQLIWVVQSIFSGTDTAWETGMFSHSFQTPATLHLKIFPSGIRPHINKFFLSGI